MAEEIARYMREHDRMAAWLHVEMLGVKPGYAKIGMTVREDMLNAAGVCQGGALFSFADFAFAVASNSHGPLALALSGTINFIRPACSGDRLVAEAEELQRSKKTGFYRVTVTRETDSKLMALFSGNVFVKDEPIRKG